MERWKEDLILSKSEKYVSFGVYVHCALWFRADFLVSVPDEKLYAFSISTLYPFVRLVSCD